MIGPELYDEQLELLKKMVERENAKG